LADGKIACKVIFFAAAAQAIQCREMDVTIDFDATAGEAFDLLAENCEQLKKLSSVCAFAINGHIAKRNATLHEGCTVAILPPVSGG
jgi:molybdopterin converting factor small subunit